MKSLTKEYEQRKREVEQALKVYQNACVKLERVKHEMSKLQV